VFNHDLDKAVR